MADFNLTQTGTIVQNVINKVISWVNNKIQRDDIADMAINTDKLDDGSVTTDKLDVDAVTDIELADDAVITSKIKDKAVTNDKIADGTIWVSKLYKDLQNILAVLDEWVATGITAGSFSEGCVSTTDIGDNAITLSKIANDVKAYITNRLRGNNASLFADRDPIREVTFTSSDTSSERHYIIAANLKTWLDSLCTEMSNPVDSDGNQVPFFIVRVNFDGADMFILNMLRSWSSKQWIQFCIGGEPFIYNSVQYIHPSSVGNLFFRTCSGGTWTNWKSDSKYYDLTSIVNNVGTELEGVSLSMLLDHHGYYDLGSNRGKVICHHAGAGWFWYDSYASGVFTRSYFALGDGTNGVKVTIATKSKTLG